MMFLKMNNDDWDFLKIVLISILILDNKDIYRYRNIEYIKIYIYLFIF